MKRLGRIFIFIIIVIALGIYAKNYLSTNPSDNTQIEDTAPADTDIVVDSIEEINNMYVINAQFPKSGIGSPMVQNKVKDIIQAFKDSTENNILNKDNTANAIDAIKKGEDTLDITYSYTKGYKYITHEINENVFTGGAHGITFVHTHTYDIATGKEVNISDLLVYGQDSLNLLADLLSKQILEQKGIEADDWFSDGTAPIEENYNTFIIDGENIIFVFQEYQIGPYALGITRIELPMTAFAGVLNF